MNVDEFEDEEAVMRDEDRLARQREEAIRMQSAPLSSREEVEVDFSDDTAAPQEINDEPEESHDDWIEEER